MENKNLAETKILRERTLKLLLDMRSRNVEFDLPETPKSFDDIVEELSNDLFKVAIIGEAKRGKSSFINALLSQEILPVDEEVATSQAFYINYSEEESFYLVFIDGTKLEIEKEELYKYGSQKIDDEQGRYKTYLDKEILWIEINVPNKFLPKNIIIIDTPGLGALYAKHAEITYNVFPIADAFIFTLESQRPLLELERSAIRRLLKWSPHIFFIQTKIDQTKEWEETLERNKQILKDTFPENFSSNLEIWPISNVNLLKASKNEKYGKQFLEISRFDELKFHLEKFIFEVSGLIRIRAGLGEALDYYKICYSNLNKRISSLKAESNTEVIQRRDSLKMQLKDFELEWEQPGTLKKKYLTRYNSKLKSFKIQFQQVFETNGSVYEEVSEQINECRNPSELSKIEEDLLRIIQERVEDAMLDLNNDIESELKEFLESLVLESNLTEQFFFDEKLDKKLSNIEEHGLQRLKAQIQKTIRTQPVMEKSRGSKLGKAIAKTARFLFTPIFLLIRKFTTDKIQAGEKLLKGKEILLSKTRKVLSEMYSNIKKIKNQGGQRLSFQEQYFSSYSDILNSFIEDKYKNKVNSTKKEIQHQEQILKTEKEEHENQISKLKEEVLRWQRFHDDGNNIEESLEKVRSNLMQQNY